MLLPQGSVLNNPRDRRAMRRFSINLPASVRVSGIPFEFATQTENISAQGLFFYMDRWMSKGTRVEVTMVFPPQVTFAEPQYVRLQARVVRVEPLTFERVGVGAVIEDYEILGAQGSAISGEQGRSASPL
jgi:PilZ domain-containing protein